MRAHQITDIKSIKRFAYAGKATITLLDTRSNERITYKITRLKDKATKQYKDVFFVKAQSGRNYLYAGALFGAPGDQMVWNQGAKSAFGEKDKRVLYLRALVNCINKNELPAFIQVWHEGICGCCGKALKVPESIETGLGPVCYARIRTDETILMRRA